MGTVLITGSSGFIGTHLTRRLTSEGIRVICVDIKEPRERLEGVDYRKMDVRELSSFETDRDIDRVYNFAAIHTTPGHKTHEYYETNIAGALEVTQLAERLGIEEIVFTSSISVYGPGEEMKIETSSLKPVSSYGYSKMLAERVHRHWFERGSNRKLTVARPAVVFGAGERGNFTRMAGLLKKGFFIYPGRKDTIKAFIYVQDLLDAIEFARNNADPHITFNVAYPGRYTIEQLVSTLIACHFPKAKAFLLPRAFVTVGAKALGAANVLNIGIHPDRVTKLVQSTDIFPEWLHQNAFPFPTDLTQIMRRWAEETSGTFI